MSATPAPPQPASVAVRPAAEADLEGLVRLNAVVQDLHARLYPADFKAQPDPAALAAALQVQLNRPGVAAAIAELDGRAAGYVLFETDTRPESAFRYARSRLYVHHLAVDPGLRGRGVGTALMSHVAERAAATGAAEVALDVWAANRRARRFFRQRGFVAARAVLHRPVGG